jgi:hypothetical protein
MWSAQVRDTQNKVQKEQMQTQKKHFHEKKEYWTALCLRWPTMAGTSLGYDDSEYSVFLYLFRQIITN